MNKVIFPILMLFALCGCSRLADGAGRHEALPATIGGDFPANLVSASADTLVCVARERSAQSTKSQSKDTFVASIYDVKSGKKTMGLPLTRHGVPFQAKHAWANGDGALIYGFTQTSPGKKNRKYSLLRLVPDSGTVDSIPLKSALHPVFFDDTTMLLGWKNRNATAPTLSLLSIADTTRLPDHAVAADFFHAETDGQGNLYLFSGHSGALSVSRHTLRPWGKSWQTSVNFQWTASTRVVHQDGILCIQDAGASTGLNATSGAPVSCPPALEGQFLTAGDAYVIQRTPDGLVVTKGP